MLSSIDSVIYTPAYTRPATDAAIKPFEIKADIAPPPEPKPEEKKETGDRPPGLDRSLFDLMRKFFDAGDKRADIDGNGQLNVNDFAAFLNRFAAGINPFTDPVPPTDPTVAANEPAPNGPLDRSLFDLMTKLFTAGDMRADINHDGRLDVSDFGAFQNLYAQGINPFRQPSAANDPAVASVTDPVVEPLMPEPFRRMMQLFATGDKLADIDRDGQLTVADFGRFQTLYAMGIDPFAQPSVSNDPAPDSVTEPLTMRIAANDPASRFPAWLADMMHRAFAAGHMSADIDRDGQLTLADFGALETAYGMGLNPPRPASAPATLSYDVDGKFLPPDNELSRHLLDVVG